MEIRQAILKAADQVDRTPEIFNYWNTRVPPCGSPGCAIGLIASNLGFQDGLWVGKNCPRILGVDSHEFYRRMTAAAMAIAPDESWMDGGDLAVKTFRAYAEKYHPAPALPAAVRSIFEMSNADLAAALDAA